MAKQQHGGVSLNEQKTLSRFLTFLKIAFLGWEAMLIRHYHGDKS
jgi:hypothetical protein